MSQDVAGRSLVTHEDEDGVVWMVTVQVMLSALGEVLLNQNTQPLRVCSSREARPGLPESSPTDTDRQEREGQDSAAVGTSQTWRWCLPPGSAVPKYHRRDLLRQIYSLLFLLGACIYQLGLLPQNIIDWFSLTRWRAEAGSRLFRSLLGH